MADEERRKDGICRDEFYSALDKFRDDIKKDLKEHVDLKMDATINIIKGHSVALFGQEGRNGIVGDVNDLKSDAKWVKYLAGIIGAVTATLGHWIGVIFGVGNK